MWRLATPWPLLFAPFVVFAQQNQQQPPPPPPPPGEPVYRFYSTVFGTSAIKPGGLTGLVYELPAGTAYLPSFKRMRPVSKIYATSLNIPSQNFDSGFPGVPGRFEWFAIDYTGNFWISKPGKYRFTLLSDDGSILFIDGHRVIDNDGIHPPLPVKGSISLKAGQHSIRIAYFQGPRYQLALTLHIAPPGEPMRIFDTDQFAPPPGGE